MPDRAKETTLQQANRLRRELEDHKRAIENAKNSLEHIERTCNHKWPNAAEQIKVKAYHDVRDESRDEKRGSDFWPGSRSEMYWKIAWRRVCSVCGKVEITTETQRISPTLTPKF